MPARWTARDSCGALRGALPDIGWLYAMTIAMGAGVAVMQVTMPPAVRTWLPHRIGFATAGSDLGDERICVTL